MDRAELDRTRHTAPVANQPASGLAELQNWYAAQVDDDWEHGHGITISTLDNPGWRLEIELPSGELAERAFREIEDSNSECDWVICKVEAGKFVATGGPLMLERMINLFLEWVRGEQPPRP